MQLAQSPQKRQKTRKRDFYLQQKFPLEDETQSGNMKKNASCATLFLYNLTLITLDTTQIVNPYQSITESINLSIYLTINQLINHSLTQLINQSISQSISQAGSQSINQSIHQSINQTSFEESLHLTVVELINLWPSLNSGN